MQFTGLDNNYTDLSEESVDPISEIIYYLKGKTIKN